MFKVKIESSKLDIIQRIEVQHPWLYLKDIDLQGNFNMHYNTKYDNRENDG